MDEQRIWLLSGTGEGPPLAAELLRRGWQLRVSVVSSTAARAYPAHPALELQIGALGDEAAVQNAFAQWPCRWVVDAAHPFARSIHPAVAKACKALGQPLLRLQRPMFNSPGATVLERLEDLADQPLERDSLLLALGKLHGGDSPTLWVLAALSVPVFLALGNIYRARYWPSGATPLSLAPGMLLGGAVLLVATAALGVDFTPRLDSTLAVALLVAQMLLFAAVYALFFILQNLAGTVFLSQIGSVAAITGAAMAIGLFGEQGSLSMLLAALCIVGGVLLVAWRGAKEAQA